MLKTNNMEAIKKLFTNLMKLKSAKPINLNEILQVTFKYEPIPFNFNNVGTYKR